MCSPVGVMYSSSFVLLVLLSQVLVHQSTADTTDDNNTETTTTGGGANDEDETMETTTTPYNFGELDPGDCLCAQLEANSSALPEEEWCKANLVVIKECFTKPENGATCTEAHKEMFTVNLPAKEKKCDDMKDKKNKVYNNPVKFIMEAGNDSDTKEKKAADEDDGTRIQYNPLLLLLVGSAVVLFGF